MTQPRQIANPDNAWVNTLESQNPAILALAKQLITEQIYCTLSTVSPENSPWGTPLLFVYDEAFNLYWSSAIAAQHSQNIYHHQGKSAITIYDANQIKAVYCTGITTELTEGDRLTAVLQLFDQRAKRPTARVTTDYLDPSPRRMYQFTMQNLWITGDRLMFADQLIDTKIQLNPNDLREMFSSL